MLLLHGAGPSCEMYSSDLQIWLKRNVQLPGPAGAIASGQGSQQGPRVQASDLEPAKPSGARCCMPSLQAHLLVTKGRSAFVPGITALVLLQMMLPPTCIHTIRRGWYTRLREHGC